MKIKNTNFELEKQKYLDNVKNLNTKLFKVEFQNKINQGPQIKKLFLVYDCTNDKKLINPIRAFKECLRPIIFVNGVLVAIWILFLITIIKDLITNKTDQKIIICLLYMFTVPFYIINNLMWFKRVIRERKEVLINNNIIKPKRYITDIKKS